MLRKHLMILAVTLLSVISIGCATMPTSQQETSQQEVAKYVANFNYTPDSQGAPGSAGVTFGIGNVGYVPSNMPSGLWMLELVAIKKASNGKLLWFFFSQFDNLNKALEQDLPELLTAKGFSVRGPFDSYDLIPFQDKKAIDLYLIPKLELSFMVKDEKGSIIHYSTGDVVDYSAGNVEVTGRIILELREIVTRELMWYKSIPLTKFEFPYSTRAPYPIEKGFKFNLIMNDVAKGIEQQYPNLMATVSKLIDPEEMRIIQKQAQELKSKKGY